MSSERRAASGEGPLILRQAQDGGLVAQEGGIKAQDGGVGTSQPSTLNSQLRIGCLPYLNVKPLVYPFEHGEMPAGWEMVYATPSKLAGMLASREIAAAPVSSFACLANPDLAIVPNICISSDGPVDTVLMLSKVEPKLVKTVAADTSSLSGRSLLRIVLSENYRVEPEFIDCVPDIDLMLDKCDAALIIGNPAMVCDKTGLEVVDLGWEWERLTELPAVFAVWAGPQESITPELVENLQTAKKSGESKLSEIAEEQAPKLKLSVEVCYRYLSSIMRYDLGEKEIQSLRLFGQKAYEHGLLEHEPSVRIIGK